MPVVIVEMWEGRTEEQKEKLIKGDSESVRGDRRKAGMA